MQGWDEGYAISSRIKEITNNNTALRTVCWRKPKAKKGNWNKLILLHQKRTYFLFSILIARPCIVRGTALDSKTIFKQGENDMMKKSEESEQG